MFSIKSSVQRVFGAIAVTSCLLTGVSSPSWAQSNPGFTLWGGIARESQLNYYLDYGGQPDQWDRYRLRIPAKKMDLGVAQFAISYPDYYDGKFDPKKVEVRVKGKSVPLSEVNWDKDNRVIQIAMQEPIPAGNGVEIVLSNVRNPAFGGTYYFNITAQSPGDVPLPRYVGTCILSIGRSN